uniref:Secreted protein n=1 Tax=Ascaris lumbricoides TaxID=6252 RepID=A0A0M3IPZ8_ASCLU
MAFVMHFFFIVTFLTAYANARHIVEEEDKPIPEKNDDKDLTTLKYYSCPHLNPTEHAQPHANTDITCEQRFTGSSNDQGCSCDYLVAERDSQGCAKSYYTLCQREKVTCK